MKAAGASWRLVGLLAAAVVPAACGEGGSAGDDGSAVDATEDAEPDAATDETDVEDDGDGSAGDPGDTPEDDGGAPTTLSVLVTGSVWWAESAPDPLPNALVALDAPDGRRIERSTGPDGRVTFTDLDWTMGPAAVTAWSDGFAMASRLGIIAADGEIHLDVSKPYEFRPRFAVLHGWAANMADDGHLLAVSATLPNTVFMYGGPEWWIELVPLVPFTLVGAELSFASLPGPRSRGWEVFGWVVRERSGAVGWTEVDLDFATTTAASTAHGSFALPPDRDGALYSEGEGELYVTTISSAQTAILGFETRAELLPDESGFDYDVEWVAPAEVTDPLTLCWLGLSWPVGDPQRETATVRVDGYPTDGPFPVPFLDAPRVLRPADPVAGHPLAEPIVWELHDEDADVAIVLHRLDPDGIEDELLWTVVVPRGTTSAVVPELPLALDPAVFFGTGGIDAYVMVSRTAASGAYIAQETRSQAFFVDPE